MSYVEKMDALDLIIATLKEHEKALDMIISRLDASFNRETGESSEKTPRTRGASLENWR